MITLDAFIARLERAIVEVKPEIAAGLEKVGQLAESIAAELPGHYQPGWAPLAESTLRDKERQGYPVPSPLKRTGKMAGSYRKEVDPFDLVLVIGSPKKEALWQEEGTSRIPPRPVTEPALKNSLPFASDVFGKIAVSLLTGEKP